MVRPCLIIIVCIVIGFPASVSAQNDKTPELWIGIQANALTSFQVNSTKNNKAQSQGIVFSMYDAEISHFGLDLHLFRGFDSAVDFLYGGGIFYTFTENDILKLKSGINVSRFAVNDYRREGDVVGGKVEDQFPDTFKPYLEFDWSLAKSIALKVQGGYRISRSDVTTIKEIFERYPDGSPLRVHANDTQKWYGSGFEFGMGLKVKVY